MTYHRYHIDTQQAPDIVPWPSRFKVKVKAAGLARLLISESIQYRLNPDVVLSRPCVYGVFSGPIGGFLPREHLCVGCLRCTTQYPDWVQISPNPERGKLGDSYFTPDQVNAVIYEASSGRIPVRGAGYRGRFGGEGWDGMWTDMSEIVRPTRDGIHGREFISTSVDIGPKPNFLRFDAHGEPAGPAPQTFSLPVPFLFDAPPSTLTEAALFKTLALAAGNVQTLALLPVQAILDHNLRGPQIAPFLTPREVDLLQVLPFDPRLIVVDGWGPALDPDLYRQIYSRFPDAIVSLRRPFASGEDLLAEYRAGMRVFHLTADFHGRGADGRFVFDLIRAAHQTFVDAGIRQEVTLLGSGGIIAAEHVPKAIIAGLDAVVLNSPLLVALQARFDGEFRTRRSKCKLPRNLSPDWGSQRLMNLSAAWRDQLLEILGAMGLREVRRLRGEMGRAIFQADLERETFAGIEGYGARE